MMLEKDLEKKCRHIAEDHGGELKKWVSPGNRGVPDRILFMPGFTVFLEFKRERNYKTGPLQDYWQRRLTELGNHVVRVHTLNDFLAVLRSYGIRVESRSVPAHSQEKTSPTLQRTRHNSRRARRVLHTT